jgi:hypothetical protein
VSGGRIILNGSKGNKRNMVGIYGLNLYGSG